MSITPTYIKIQDEISQSSDFNETVFVSIWNGSSWVVLYPSDSTINFPQNPYAYISPNNGQVSDTKNATFELEINPAAVREIGQAEDGSFLIFTIGGKTLSLGTDGITLQKMGSTDSSSFTWDFQFNGWNKDVIIELKDPKE